MKYEQIGGCLGKCREWILEDKKRTGKILAVVIILVIAIILRINDNVSAVELEEQPETQMTMYVDISGAVNKPGIYSVDGETRLYEVIELAGGLSEDADIDSINQAEFVEDGQKILIPVVSRSGEITVIDNSTGISGTTASAGKININTASKDELKQLTGIGDVIADRIIEYRSSTRFKSIDEIKSVKGIGDSIFEKIKERICV